MSCAKVRSDLERRGRPIGPNDMLIAAHALSLGLVLVTDDIREFGRIGGSTWRAGTRNDLHDLYAQTILVTMSTASVSELKANLSRHLREVRRGGEVEVLDCGAPVARLVPPAVEGDRRGPACMAS